MNTVAKILIRTLAALLLIVLSFFVLVYIPPVQERVKDYVLSQVRESAGMDISVGHLGFSFPAHIEVENAVVADVRGDTMASVGRVEARARLLPLLRLKVTVDDILIENACYRMTPADSSMNLDVMLDEAVIDRVSLDVGRQSVDVGVMAVTGGDVILVLGNDTIADEDVSQEPVAWQVKADEIKIKDVDYYMSMNGVIDSLYAHIDESVVENAAVDMYNRQIVAGSLMTGGLSAGYFFPSPESTRDADAVEDKSHDSVSEPWTVVAEKIVIGNSDALYALSGHVPAGNGLDTDYLQAKDISVEIDSFYNRGTSIRVPLKSLAAIERCGIAIEAGGVFEMDSVAMKASDFRIKTQDSEMSLDALLGTGENVAEDMLPVRVLADVKLGVADIGKAYPVYGAFFTEMSQNESIGLTVDVDGTMGDISINGVNVDFNRHLSVVIGGQVRNISDIDGLSGHLDLSGTVTDAGFVRTGMADDDAAKIEIPPMTIEGLVNMDKGEIDGHAAVVTQGRRVALDAKWNGNGEKYGVKLVADSFPVNAFLPKSGLGMVAADVSVDGQGFDWKSRDMRLDADVKLSSFEYNGRVYGNARAWAIMEGGEAEAGMVSLNPVADFDFIATAKLAGDTIDWEVTGDVRHMDLKAVNLSETYSAGSLSLNGSGRVDVKGNSYEGRVNVGNLDWSMSGMSMQTTEIDASLTARDSLVRVGIRNNDLVADFVALASADTLLARISRTMALLDSQIVRREIDVSGLQKELPRFSAHVTSGGENVLSCLLASSDVSIEEMALSVDNDSLFNINGKVLRLKMGETRLDTVSFGALQHQRFLVYKASIGNAPGTMDGFARVDLNGYVAKDKISAFVKQRNLEGKQGFNLGVITSIGDSVVNVRLMPLTPVIGYRQWSVNRNNFLDYNFYTRHLDADIQLIGQDSHLKLYTEHIKDGHTHQEDVVLNIYNLKLDELMKVSPFAPPVKGGLSADMRFRWDDSSIGGRGSMSLKDMYIGRERVGTFDLGLDLSTDKRGEVKAEAALMVDSVKTITVAGALNDTTQSSPVSLDFTMIKFPLKVLNPFLPRKTASINGMLNGQMAITGELASPRFDGYVSFDTTRVKIDMIDSDFRFSDEKIPVRGNVVAFEHYTIKGANENPLAINGVVDMRDFMTPKIELAMSAQNMQFMNSTRGKGTDIYGRGFANLDATIKGDMSLLNVDASVDLLGGSNITYVMADAATALASQSSDGMVRFVQFSDTAEVVEADTLPSSAMTLNLNARLTVSGGTTINVDLSADGKNRVQLQGRGTLNYMMNDMYDSRFIGRYTIDKGFVRYTPPLMSEKLFNFREGSYVAFNGDMFNPILSLYADDEIKANVTREGQDSRLVNFDVSLAVTNTLSNMDVAFDLSTNEDISIQNELQSMSAEQRANQAMNMLLYNVYTGPGTKTDMSGNPLYSFLESQINTWAANNIKFVDISFGIDQYDKTSGGATSTTTSYSYKVSKTLFNDRFKIVIGGNYSTDTETDEDVAQNLVNDISFEYMLNRSGSMYVKIFRHVGYESILEGEVTQTGVGFVYKRKIHSLKDLFRWIGRRKDDTQAIGQEKTEVDDE